MIKRSALVAILATAGSVAFGRHVHGPNHASHKFAAKHQNDSAPVQTKVKGDLLPDVDNENICSFYQDDSFYLLKPIISRNNNYETTLEDRYRVQFNICNRTVGFAPEHVCYGSYACLTDEQ